MVRRGVMFRVWKYVQSNKQTIMAMTQVFGVSTMHSTICNKKICWFSFLEKGNLFSLCFEIWGVTAALRYVSRIVNMPKLVNVIN
jgi:hypothetical protein